MENKRGLSRRGFTLAAAAMPVVLAQGESLAQTPAPVRPVPQGGAGSAGYIRPDSISSVVTKLAGDPFASPIVFERKEAPAKLKPFALKEVRLGKGPFREAHD